MRILGLDIGSTRIGVAMSDELGITAQGLTTIRRENDQDMFEQINKLVLDHGVKMIIVGLPLNMDGSSGPQAKAAIQFADILKEKLSNVNIKLWDERLTTMEAERLLINADMSRRYRKRKIDKLAAQLILRGYLDSARMP